LQLQKAERSTMKIFNQNLVFRHSSFRPELSGHIKKVGTKQIDSSI
jgi:hypothetical protein